MKLIIREYLSLLRESEELDALLADLILSMDIRPISKPQRGVRQYGVDLAAIGIDPEDGIKKIFLFIIKQKDIDRNSWHSGPQSVRPTLDEVFDVYLTTMIESPNKQLPKKIVLATNGDLAQSVQLNWKGYTDEKRRQGEIEFDFWGGDKISSLIQEYLFNEFMFPSESQSYLRKTLAFLDMSDYDMSHYFELAELTLFKRENVKSIKERIKVLRFLHLTVNLIFHWSSNADNIKPAILAIERLSLRVWEWFIKNSLFEDKSLVGEFFKLETTRIKIYLAYFNKVQAHCYVRDGLSGYGADEIEYPLRTFELIGILGTFGSDLLFRSSFDEQNREVLISNAFIVAEALSGLIYNNKSSLYPLFDGHINDITIAMHFLYYFDKKDEIITWLSNLLNYLFLNYRFFKRFPILSDSYDELVEIQLGNIETKVESSTLLPILLEWTVIMKEEKLFQEAKDAITELFPKVNLQIWYPDDSTEQAMYNSNALSETGTMRTSIEVPENIEVYRKLILDEKEHCSNLGDFSFLRNGYPIIGLLSSRHFRTPVFPFYWRQFI